MRAGAEAAAQAAAWGGRASDEHVDQDATVPGTQGRDNKSLYSLYIVKSARAFGMRIQRGGKSCHSESLIRAKQGAAFKDNQVWDLKCPHEMFFPKLEKLEIDSFVSPLHSKTGCDRTAVVDECRRSLWN